MRTLKFDIALRFGVPSDELILFCASKRKWSEFQCGKNYFEDDTHVQNCFQKLVLNHRQFCPLSLNLTQFFYGPVLVYHLPKIATLRNSKIFEIWFIESIVIFHRDPFRRDPFRFEFGNYPLLIRLDVNKIYSVKLLRNKILNAIKPFININNTDKMDTDISDIYELIDIFVIHKSSNFKYDTTTLTNDENKMFNLQSTVNYLTFYVRCNQLFELNPILEDKSSKLRFESVNYMDSNDIDYNSIYDNDDNIDLSWAAHICSNYCIKDDWHNEHESNWC